MHVSALYVHPVKACAAISPAAWPVGRLGLEHDRRWMVIDRAGRFVTQREEPRLALVHPRLEGPELRLDAPGMPPLAVPREAPDGEAREVVVWRDAVPARLPSPAADAWLSALLGRDVALAWLADPGARPVDPAYADPGDRVSFADGFPFLVAGQASLDELNRRLPAPVPMTRFRPNVVVAGGAPFAEDGWRRLRVGPIELHLVKPCARCKVTTVDPATAETGKEPLRTLATFRKVDGEVLFGQNALHRGAGMLRVGDPVEVLEEA